MIKKRNKRAQELSTNAIVLIILAVVILVILIFGFTMGWNKIAPWISSGNIDTIVKQCGIACNTQSVYDYCSKEMELKADDLPDGEKMKKATCYFFSKNSDYAKYGIQSCEAVDCNAVLKKCGDISAEGYNSGSLQVDKCGENDLDLSNRASDITSEKGYCCAITSSQ